MAVYPEFRLRRYSQFVYGLMHLQLIYPGMSVTSWGRSQARNAAKGGIPNSQHLHWTAVDVEWDPGTRPEYGELAGAAARVGLEVVPEPDHDHIELAPGGA